MWSEEWPTEAGFYWFYGYQGRYDKERGKRRLAVVEVKRPPSSVYYIENGAFMYRSEGNEGVWQPIETPALPED